MIQPLKRKYRMPRSTIRMLDLHVFVLYSSFKYGKVSQTMRMYLTPMFEVMEGSVLKHEAIVLELE